MKNILNSASKTVFVLMALAVIILTVLGKVDPKDFIALASMAFAFYFTRDKGNDTPAVAAPVEKEIPGSN